jgi:hypothetical protein
MADYRHTHHLGRTNIECIVKTKEPTDGNVRNGVGYIPKPEDNVLVNLRIGSHYFEYENGKPLSMFATAAHGKIMSIVEMEVFNPPEAGSHMPEYIIATLERGIGLSRKATPPVQQRDSVYTHLPQ